MTCRPVVLVCGATGRQGGAVARRLLRDGWSVRALTRTPEGSAAKRLREQGAEIRGGDLEEPGSLREALAGAEGVFGVTEFWEHGFRAEVRQGKNLVDAALGAGSVRHFVFSSVGATERTAGLGITHFESKREIEEHLRGSGLTWTILRPVTFFENFISPRYRRAICKRGVFRFAIAPERPFQMIAMEDLAVFAARAFAEREAFRDRAVELASDRFTMTDFCRTVADVIGRPVRYECLSPLAQRAIAAVALLTRSSGRYKIGPSLVAQFRWNNESDAGGWNANLAALRAIHPGLMTVRDWASTIDWRAGLSG